MPSAARILALDHPLYSMAELIEHRRNILRYARSFPPGPERNQHRQIALSLRAFQEEGLAGSPCVERLRMIRDGRRPLSAGGVWRPDPDLDQAIFSSMCVSNNAH